MSIEERLALPNLPSSAHPGDLATTGMVQNQVTRRLPWVFSLRNAFFAVSHLHQRSMQNALREALGHTPGATNFLLGLKQVRKPSLFEGPWENSLRACTDSAFGTFSLSLLNHARSGQIARVCREGQVRLR